MTVIKALCETNASYMYSVHELKWPLTKLFESLCDKLVITLTRDAYGKYNSRALTRTQVIFPVIIT